MDTQQVAREYMKDAEIERLRYALQRIANCGQSVEPDHWKFRCMAREVAKEALRQSVK